MRSEFPFPRDGRDDESDSAALPDGDNFVQVPEHLVRGLSPEQWQALQATYRAAWEKARQALDKPDPGFGGAGNYQI
jgi:hypothetical protein